MIPSKKLDVKIDRPFVTDVRSTFTTGRDYRALLRSTGHLKRDGLWLGYDDPFHVYREIENPGLGALKTFQGSSFWKTLDPSIDIYGPKQAVNWKPSLVRSYEWTDWIGSYNNPLPEVVVPAYEDKILELNALGTSFIRQLRPGNPIAGLDQMLIELRELPRLPLLLRSRAKTFRDLGSEYLNVEFGWIPFVKDVIQVGHAQLRMNAVLDKLVKDNGIRIKRRSKRETVSASSDWNTGVMPYNMPFNWLGFVPGSGSDLIELDLFGPTNTDLDFDMTGQTTVRWQSRVVTESWFVGTYVYYVPDIGSSRWTNKAKAILSGIKVTPSTLYSVYPWTWLADWFANVGDILSNLSANAVDQEANFNAHVMQTVTDQLRVDAEISWDLFEPDLGNGPAFSIAPGTDTVSYSLIKKQKLRQKASAFGFGLKTGDFTFRQKSILAALLFSRKVPKLR